MSTRRQSKGHGPSAPAKISPPRLGSVQPRPRLDKAFDRLRRQAAIVWVSAPAGAGKTTLVANYIKNRRLKSLWYQFDSRDVDPATFFYYLGQAVARLAPRKRTGLPLLTPEFLPAISVFARNFFELVAARIKPPAVIVLDNYQELPDDSPLHALLAEGVATFPHGLAFIVLSRTEPPPAFARVHAHRAMSRLGWGEIRLTRAELPGFVHRHGETKISGAALDRLYADTNGWAAGVTLLLEGQADAPPDALGHDARGRLFDYFATEILSRAELATREFLFATALLPDVSVATAQTLTGERRAARILSDLARRNFFTTRRAGAEAVYEYHPLFRDYLLHAGSTHFPSPEWMALKRRAGALLVAQERYDGAAQLMQDAADTVGLVGLITQHAPTLAAQGRLVTLGDWLRALPEETIADSGWLCYWLGICRLPVDLVDARARFVQAYANFRVVDDPLGLYLAWAGIVDTYFYQWDDCAPLDGWLDELEQLRQRHPPEQVPPALPRVIYSALNALSYIRPDRPDINFWVRAGESLLPRLREPDQFVLICTSLCLYYLLVGDRARLQGLARPLARPLAEQLTGAPLSPVIHLHGLVALAESSWMTGDTADGRRWLDQGFELAARQGLRMFEPFLYGQALYCYETDGDQTEVVLALARMHAALVPQRRLDHSHFHYHSAWLALARGRLGEAREHAQQALDFATALSVLYPAVTGRIRLAEVLVEQGACEEAHSHLDIVDAHVARLGSDLMRFMASVVRASARLHDGQLDDADRELGLLFRLGQRLGYRAYPGWNMRLMTTLCTRALARDIEPDYARQLIRERGLTPPDNAGGLEAWPWPVKVYTLDRFSVSVDDRRLPLDTTGQKKPFALLKVLVAYGGRDVTLDRVIEALWPDADHDAAQRNFTIALHRLRRFIGADTVVFADRRLSLDTRRVWVDAWALERHANGLGTALVSGDPRHFDEALAGLLKLYRHPFLDGEDALWTLARREQLRQKFLRGVGAAAEALARAQRHRDALACCERGLEIDPLAEALYRGAMQSLLALGERATAAVLYQRCQLILQRELGVTPAAATVALYRQALGT